jgi:hypothetical protein
MKTTPRTPKILPWLAHKAGISMPHAESLWDAARCHAQAVTGETETPACWKAAMDRLHVLVAAASLREDAAAFGWRNWSRQNNRNWETPLALLQALTQNSIRSWRVMGSLQLG